VLELLAALLKAATGRAYRGFIANLFGDGLLVWAYVETVQNLDILAQIVGPHRAGVMVSTLFWACLLLVAYCFIEFLILRKLR
jgi:hypothetical protein